MHLKNLRELHIKLKESSFIILQNLMVCMCQHRKLDKKLWALSDLGSDSAVLL